jgi:hypothetical protein
MSRRFWLPPSSRVMMDGKLRARLSYSRVIGHSGVKGRLFFLVLAGTSSANIRAHSPDTRTTESRENRSRKREETDSLTPDGFDCDYSRLK